MTSYDWACWRGGNPPDSYLGRARFDSRPEHLLSWLRISWFSSGPPGKCRDGTSIGPRPLPSKSFPVHHSSIILPFDVTVATDNKPQQEVLGRTNRLISLIRHGSHWKRRVQQFFYYCVCIRYRVNVSTEPLPSNDRGIFTEPLSSNGRGIFTELLPSNYRGIHRHTRTHIDNSVIS
jgi:hypothetical protein